MASNWKATFLLEYEDVAERRTALEKLIGVEDRVWMRVAGHDKVYAIADEDMDRENDTKTSSVHFVRFELSTEMAAAARKGAGIECGCDHPELHVDGLKLPEAVAGCAGGRTWARIRIAGSGYSLAESRNQNRGDDVHRRRVCTGNCCAFFGLQGREPTQGLPDVTSTRPALTHSAR